MARRTREQEVMDVAVDLHARLLADDERSTRDRALAVAATEVGVPPELVARATVMVDERRAAEALRRQRRTRVAMIGSAAVAAVVGLTVALWPAPVPVIVDGFEGASTRWALDKNAETSAALRPTAGADGVADHAVAVAVERFGAQADGKYHVNLDRHAALPPLDRHHQVTVRVRGHGLPVVRVFLEGDGVRWRSPPITVGAEWGEHTLTLDSFERQQRKPGGFEVVGRGDVADVRQWSLKLGHYMNPVDATGEIEIDELRFE